jgi:hypothetical protein
LAVSVGLVPGPALFPGAGAAERPQEILYLTKTRKFNFFAEIFYIIISYIRIARQFKNDFHYSNSHFGH